MSLKLNVKHNFVPTIQCETFVQKIIFFKLRRNFANFKTLSFLERNYSEIERLFISFSFTCH